MHEIQRQGTSMDALDLGAACQRRLNRKRRQRRVRRIPSADRYRTPYDDRPGRVNRTGRGRADEPLRTPLALRPARGQSHCSSGSFLPISARCLRELRNPWDWGRKRDARQGASGPTLRIGIIPNSILCAADTIQAGYPSMPLMKRNPPPIPNEAQVYPLQVTVI